MNRDNPQNPHNDLHITHYNSTLESSKHNGVMHTKKPSFWFLHIAGWVAYVIIFSFDNILFTHQSKVSWFVIIPLFVSGTIAGLLTLPLRYLYQRCWQLNPRYLITTMVLASLFAALIWTPAKNFVMWSLNNKNELKMSKLDMLKDSMDFWPYFDGLSYSFFMILVWTSLYFGINYHYRLIKEKLLHLEAERLSHYAQIKMLRYQINPHFLFNTLNAISTLVLLGNKEKANGMLSRLSTFLRFSLDNDPEKKIVLYEEIKALMLYLEIEKTRFDERLSINIQVQPDTEQLLVPSLLLQPLIENAIKYAIANMESGGEIKIEAYRNFDKLYLSVSDNGPGVDKTSQTHLKQSTQGGVGLKNIKDRLAVLYPQNHTFNIIKQQPQGYKVDIVIPVEMS